MKRLAVLMLIALPALANERWWEAYDRGLKALNSRDYPAAVAALEASLVARPMDSTGVRAGDKIITYLPNYWLGIAKFRSGDIEGALRAWKTSEDQRVIRNTDYYTALGAWVARAQAAKMEIAKEAQPQPTAAAPQRPAGTQIARQENVPLKPAATSTASSIETPAPAPAPEPVSFVPDAAETARRQRELKAAYRAFARGELDIAEQLLDALLLTWRSGEAYLLRGCTRYTRAILLPSQDLRGAASDFKLALLLNPDLKIDRRSFSPKLVSFFEEVTTTAKTR